MHKLAILLLILAWAASAADGNLALVRFQVQSKQNQPVTDLRPEEIEIREDGSRQKVALFEGGTQNPRSVPTDIALLFDCAGAAFTAATLDPAVFDENLFSQHERASVSIYGFSGGLARYAVRTRDLERLKKALGAPIFPHPQSTFLLEQIGVAMSDLASQQAPAVRLLIVLSDGQGDAAATSNTVRQERYNATVQVAQNAGVSIYPVLLQEPFGMQASSRSAAAAPSTSDAQMMLRTIGDFTNLGSPTGGRKFEALKGTNLLPGILKSVSEEIANEYVVGFVPSSSGEPKRRKVEIVLRDKNRGKITGGTRTLVH